MFVYENNMSTLYVFLMYCVFLFVSAYVSYFLYNKIIIGILRFFSGGNLNFKEVLSMYLLNAAIVCLVVAFLGQYENLMAFIKYIQNYDIGIYTIIFFAFFIPGLVYLAIYNLVKVTYRLYNLGDINKLTNQQHRDMFKDIFKWVALFLCAIYLFVIETHLLSVPSPEKSISLLPNFENFMSLSLLFLICFLTFYSSSSKAIKYVLINNYKVDIGYFKSKSSLAGGYASIILASILIILLNMQYDMIMPILKSTAPQSNMVIVLILIGLIGLWARKSIVNFKEKCVLFFRNKEGSRYRNFLIETARFLVVFAAKLFVTVWSFFFGYFTTYFLTL